VCLSIKKNYESKPCHFYSTSRITSKHERASGTHYPFPKQSASNRATCEMLNRLQRCVRFDRTGIELQTFRGVCVYCSTIEAMSRIIPRAIFLSQRQFSAGKINYHKTYISA